MGCFKLGGGRCSVYSLLLAIANKAKVDVKDKSMPSSNDEGAAKLCLKHSREMVAQQGKEQKYTIPGFSGIQGRYPRQL